MTHYATWQDIETNVCKLANDIKASNWMPVSIVAIGRGGAVPAVMLAHRLGIRCVDYINYSRKTGLVASSLQRFSNQANGMDGLLLIDDVSETGGTFKELSLPFSGKYKTAVLYKGNNTIVPIDFVAVEYSGEALKMPWEQ